MLLQTTIYACAVPRSRQLSCQVCCYSICSFWDNQFRVSVSGAEISLSGNGRKMFSPNLYAMSEHLVQTSEYDRYQTSCDFVSNENWFVYWNTHFSKSNSAYVNTSSDPEDYFESTCHNDKAEYTFLPEKWNRVTPDYDPLRNSKSGFENQTNILNKAVFDYELDLPGEKPESTHVVPSFDFQFSEQCGSIESSPKTADISCSSVPMRWKDNKENDHLRLSHSDSVEENTQLSADQNDVEGEWCLFAWLWFAAYSYFYAQWNDRLRISVHDKPFPLFLEIAIFHRI